MLQCCLCKRYNPVIHQSRFQLSRLGIAVVYLGEQMRHFPNCTSTVTLPGCQDKLHSEEARRKEQEYYSKVNSST